MPQPSAAPRLLALTLALAAACASSSPAKPCTAAQCDDGNPCTADGCGGEGCTHLPEPQDALCAVNGGQVCDGAGRCVACNRDAQCAGTSPSGECQHPACDTRHACVPVHLDAGTVTSTQVAGDCRRLECDGAGATRSVVDDADVPGGPTDCAVDACVDGVPTRVPVASGTACGDGSFVCNATGQCGCLTNADCAAPRTCGGGGTARVCGCTPATCAGAGITCGAPPDGCGGALSCDDAAKDGGETDVDCGGSAATCATRCATGKACLAGSDCTTGHCVDGVCCDTACTGGCQACSQAKKGNGSDGVCGAIAAGVDPDGECTASAESTCGLDGACDGAGACRRWAAGTECAAGSCASGTETHPSTCDGAGTCVSNGTTACAAYACGPTACKLTCAGDGDCAAGSYCAGVACVAKKGMGVPCSAGRECATGSCVDGFCCDTPCAGTCQACSAAKKGGGADGVCGTIVAGTDPDLECDVQGAATCGRSGACDGTGACQLHVQGTRCAPATCLGGQGTQASYCNGLGTCVTPATVDCGAVGLGCNADGVCQ